MNAPDKQTLFFSIVALSILSSTYAIDLHGAVAQSNASHAYYSENGISIRYPIDWKVEQNISKYIIVGFTAPATSDLSPAAVRIYKLQLQNTNSSNNIDDRRLFYLFSFALLDYINKTHGITNWYDNQTLLSSPAFQADSNYNGVTLGWLWTVKNSYAYIVIYAASMQYSNYYLPVVQSMINSFMLSASASAPTISSKQNLYVVGHNNHAASQTNQNNCLVNPNLLC